MRASPKALAAALSLVFALALAACGGSADSAPSPTASRPGGPTAASPLAGKITVVAASSLTDAFKVIRKGFQERHPGVTVEFSFASSSALASQIEQGTPVDVFASADVAQMKKVEEKSLLGGVPVTFARNLPVIVVPAANRAAIVSPRDLAKAGVKLVLAAPDVPIGNYARQVIDRLAADTTYGSAFRDATMKNVVSNETNVRAVLSKIELGEADAGIVYRTDALVSGSKVSIVAIPEAANVVAAYPIAVVKGSKNAAAAAAFVAFVQAPEGQAALKAAGFGPAQ